MNREESSQDDRSLYFFRFFLSIIHWIINVRIDAPDKARYPSGKTEFCIALLIVRPFSNEFIRTKNEEDWTLFRKRSDMKWITDGADNNSVKLQTTSVLRRVAFRLREAIEINPMLIPKWLIPTKIVMSR